MKQYYEKRGEMRTPYVTTVLINNLNTGKFSRARMVNFSLDGMFIEADDLLNEGDIIEIGIENSPYILFEDTIDCYKATVRRRKQLMSGVYKYGYGVQKMLAGQRPRTNMNAQIQSEYSKLFQISHYMQKLQSSQTVCRHRRRTIFAPSHRGAGGCVSRLLPHPGRRGSGALPS